MSTVATVILATMLFSQASANTALAAIHRGVTENPMLAIPQREQDLADARQALLQAAVSTLAAANP